MQSDIHAKDIMVRDVVTVSPMTTVMQVARTLVDRGLSGLPILGDGGQILGVVTEGDLLRRIETRTERQRSMWSRLFTSNSKLAAEYLKSHARRARDVMTAPVTASPRSMPSRVPLVSVSSRTRAIRKML